MAIRKKGPGTRATDGPRTPRAGERPGDGARPTRTVEIETKLELTAERALPDLAGRKRLAAVGLTGVTEPVVHDLDATYYDTDALDLLRSRMTLRRRTGGADAGWHLKLPADADGETSAAPGGAAKARPEVGLPLSAGEDGVVPDELLRLTLGAARGRPLRPVARLRNSRTIRHLLAADGNPAVEVADDQVTADTLNGPIANRRSSRWRELEVELKGGTRDQLAAVVGVLEQAGATPASSASKLARALDVPSGPAAARNGRAPRTAGAVVAGAVTRLRDQLLAADRRLREGDAVAVHGARSAVSRLEAVVAVLGSVLDLTPEDAETIATGTRDLRRALGDVRDLDVIRARLVGQLVDEPENLARVAGVGLRAGLDRRESRARDQLADVLVDGGYFALLQALDRAAVAPGVSRPATRPAPGVLRGLLSTQWDRVVRRADIALDDPENPVALHRARKAAKRLRFAVEAVAAALGLDAVVFAAALEEVQETLGEHRDAVLATELLADLAADETTDGLVGFAYGRLHAFEQAIAAGAVDEFADAWSRLIDGDLPLAVAPTGDSRSRNR